MNRSTNEEKGFRKNSSMTTTTTMTISAQKMGREKNFIGIKVPSVFVGWLARPQ